MTEQEGVTVTAMYTRGTSFVPCDPGKTSDGYHTFDELYEHRHLLFAALMKCQPATAWRSKVHHDGSAWDGWFIAGMDIPPGWTYSVPITYHLPDRMWDLLENIRVLDRAPEWDGHTSQDVLERLEQWVNGIRILYVSPNQENDRNA